jgi:hypothetical protein
VRGNPEINAGETHQIARQNHNIKVANKFTENIVKFKYLRAMATNQIYSRLNSGMPDTTQFKVFYLPVFSIKT